MNYLSVCSGIEAATVAWHHMGWKPVGFSEIEKFPSQVLAHHYPQVTNFGDMTKYKEWNLESIDILVGGTPCQSFSVAGLRKGLEDPRGNLMLTYCGLLDKFRPKWFIWENVPGVLSSNGGRDFGSFLGAVEELGYGFAYRVLDAQYFGVAQRRRRVFVVGCLGDWKSAAKVLFEPESLCRNTPPRRKSREEIASTITARFGASRNNHEECVVFKSDIANCLQTTSHECSSADGFNMIAYENHPSDSRVKEMGDVCSTVTSSWGTGGGNTPYVQIVYPIHPQAESFQDGGRKNNDGKGNALGVGEENDPMFTLTTVDKHAVAFDTFNYTLSDVNQTIKSPQGGVNESIGTVLQAIDTYNLTINSTNQTIRSGSDIDHIGGVLQDKPTAYGFLPTQGSKAQGIGFEEEQAPTLRAGCDSYGLLQTPIGFHVNARPDEMKFEDDLSGTMTKSQIPGVHGIAYGFEAGIAKREGNPNRFSEELSPTLRANMGDNQASVAHTFKIRGGGGDGGKGYLGSDEKTFTISTTQDQQLFANMAVRRLTPIECERLQGFPDNYTDIKPKGKDTPDGPRYKALGNSMAVPVMAWIGKRIQMVENHQVVNEFNEHPDGRGQE